MFGGRQASAKNSVFKNFKTTDNEFLFDSVLKEIPQKQGIFHPCDENDIIKIVNYAIQKSATVRVLGSQHSPDQAIFSQQKNCINLILDGDLKKIHSIQADKNGEFATVRVGAGCHLGVDPRDEDSTLENSFNFQVDSQGYALPILGGITHQTIAGFLQTSSTGGSVAHGVADAIEEIEFIDGKGSLRTLKKGDDDFNAAAVSMGLFGVITSVTFRLPQKYLVEGRELNQLHENSYLVKGLDGQYSALSNALFEDNEYAHINWLPQPGLKRTMQWTGKSVPFDSPIKPYRHALQSSALSFFASAALGVSSMIDEYASNNRSLQQLKSSVLKNFVDLDDKQTFCDKWYKALPIDDQIDVDGLIDTAFSEIWYPRGKIPEVMRALEDLFDSNPKAAGNFIVEFYAAKKSPYWLSPSYDHDAFRVDLYWWKHNAGMMDNYFGIFWEKLLQIEGARLHWGKYMPIPGKSYGDFVFDAEHIKRNYPRFEEWKQLREKMDPHQLFVTDHWRQILQLPEKSIELNNEVSEERLSRNGIRRV